MRAAAGGEAFPWDDVIAVGLGLLRLPPKDFWAMTTREFAAVANSIAGRGGRPIARPGLEALMKRFPDRTEDTT